MGTTATGLHIWSSDDLAGAVAAAYERERINLVPIDRREASTRVVTVRPGDGWLTVMDETSGAPDIAALAQIAVALTKTTDSVAILTSVLDSDAFQLVLFVRGEQVDVVASEPIDGDARLAQLSTLARERTWGALFPAATHESLTQADRVESPFAEEELAAWCAVVGLDPARIVETPAEAASAAGVTVRAAMAGDGTERQAASTQLSFYPSPDDTPYLRLFPAAWPVSPGASQSFTWLVTSADGGFDGLDCSIETDPPNGVEISAISLTAHSFYNGQITSQHPLASFEARTTGEGRQAVRAEPFSVPNVDPSSRKQIIIRLRLTVTVTGDVSVTIRPALNINAPLAPLTLPPLRLQTQQPTWLPLGSTPRASDPLAAIRTDAVVGLNQPSIRSFVAIHGDLNQPLRNQLQDWCADWLGSLALEDETSVTVHTQKHMTASFRVSKNTRTVAADTLTANKIWPRLFRADDGYQTVRLSIEQPGYAFPVAGLTIQESLINEAAMTPTHVDALGTLLGSGATAPQPIEVEQRTLAVVAWTIDHPDIDRFFGTSPMGFAQSADTWCDQTDPIQAWATSSLWVPEFDLYDEYHETLYEDACAIDWFRSGARGALGTIGWTTRRLRFVAPKMWLGPELAGRVDLSEAERVANIRRLGNTTALSLRPNHTLTDLEHALSPILPGAGA